MTFYGVKRQRDELDVKVQRFKEVTGEYDKYGESLAGLSLDDM